MISKSAIGQEIRWVRKYNRAMDRAFVHWPIGSGISNWRKYSKHYRHAYKIERNHALTIIDTAGLPAENVDHVEPSYES